jgi:YD repeat-containing protein
MGSPRLGSIATRWVAALFLPLLIFVLSVRPAFGDIFYVYDGLGRLIAVVDSNGQGAGYSYDAVGNLLAITRFNASNPPAVNAIVPAEG